MAAAGAVGAVGAVGALWAWGRGEHGTRRGGRGGGDGGRGGGDSGRGGGGRSGGVGSPLSAPERSAETAGPVPGQTPQRPRGSLRGGGRSRTRSGLERLLAVSEQRAEDVSEALRVLEGRRVGLVCNHTALTSDMEPALEALLKREMSLGFVVAAVFAPEHGFRGAAQAGEAGDVACDGGGEVFVRSIYGLRGAALEQVFAEAGVDALLYDIQDVGCRFYTYIWTLHDCMEAAGSRPVVVLDRPNPLGCAVVAGPVLNPAEASFVGRRAIALRHGMTAGELARFFAGEFLGPSPISVAVVRVGGLRRALDWEEMGLPWVAPSPNMPGPQTACVYPGTGLLEGTNVSEGRGTTQPFELLGAPWIDDRLASELRARAAAGCLPGVVFRDARFVPAFGKYAGTAVRGVQVHVTDRVVFDPILTGVHILVLLRTLYPSSFAWTPNHFIDRLAGDSDLREAIDGGAQPSEIAARWDPSLRRFRRLRQAYLLYR